ncbi:hypothetical protein AWJ20_2828 [Sugiyamaella lignohabitans]|uniref:Uncharacterized protein n=1 Tax=Sugiyamaella lignohabitans TaxID=796027 RepID=A0A167FEN4_9ASCO|nr:uncharacterized protein AWJ20_2828 [Sugiyamaella lignohabitans]ANB15204.1 hypothetical protein AWJ20_2828 [Sugiyamaella lignohabitans]
MTITPTLGDNPGLGVSWSVASSSENDYEIDVDAWINGNENKRKTFILGRWTQSVPVGNNSSISKPGEANSQSARSPEFTVSPLASTGFGEDSSATSPGYITPSYTRANGGSRKTAVFKPVLNASNPASSPSSSSTLSSDPTAAAALSIRKHEHHKHQQNIEGHDDLSSECLDLSWSLSTRSASSSTSLSADRCSSQTHAHTSPIQTRRGAAPQQSWHGGTADNNKKNNSNGCEQPVNAGGRSSSDFFSKQTPFSQQTGFDLNPSVNAFLGRPERVKSGSDSFSSYSPVSKEFSFSHNPSSIYSGFRTAASILTAATAIGSNPSSPTSDQAITSTVEPGVSKVNSLSRRRIHKNSRAISFNYHVSGKSSGASVKSRSLSQPTEEIQFGSLDPLATSSDSGSFAYFSHVTSPVSVPLGSFSTGAVSSSDLDCVNSRSLQSYISTSRSKSAKSNSHSSSPSRKFFSLLSDSIMSSSLDTKASGPKKLMMGIGNRIASARKVSAAAPKDVDEIPSEFDYSVSSASIPPVPSLPDIPGIPSNSTQESNTDLFNDNLFGFDFANSSASPNRRSTNLDNFQPPRINTSNYYQESIYDDQSLNVPSSPNSIQPSPVLNGGNDFDSNSSSGLFNRDASDIGDVKSDANVGPRSVSGSRSHHLGPTIRSVTNQVTGSGPSSGSGSTSSVSTTATSFDEHDYNKAQSSRKRASLSRDRSSISGLGLISDVPLESSSPPKESQGSILRMKKMFNSYTAVDQSAASSNRLSYNSDVAVTPSSNDVSPRVNRRLSDRSIATPGKDRKLPSKSSSMTFSKKLVFSNIDEVADKDASLAESASRQQLQSPINERQSSGRNDTSKYGPSPAEEADSSDSDFEQETLLPFSTSPSNTGYAGHTKVMPSHSGKVMTKSQFDHYRKSIVGLSDLVNNSDHGEGYDNDDDIGDDDEDEDQGRLRLKHLDDDPENKKESLRMRLKQDAHLSVYRQKMTKITASHSSAALSSFQTPGSRLGSSSNLSAMAINPTSYVGDMNDDDEDLDDDEYDDVPLGILKAHGFPSGPQRPLKHMPSQQSLSNLPLPSVLYQGEVGPGSGGRSDVVSLNSGYSGHSGIVPPPISMPPEGELLVKPAFTNDIFGNSTTHMNRGLIGEIAREEEAKMKRRSYGNLLSAQRAQTLMGSPVGYAGSLYNGYSSASPPPNNATANKNGNEIQQQLQQMMQMQMQMLQQIQGGNQGPTIPAQRKTVSSFDMVRQSGAPFSPRPPSLRSVAMSDRSLDLTKSPYMRSTFSQGRFSPAPQLGVRPPSGMNMVSNSAAVDDEDEEEDDEGWKEMLEKRRQLKELWKQQTSVHLVS